MTAMPSSSTPQPTREKDRSRIWSGLCAALFIPAVLAAGVLTLASERASRCLTYGEQCASALPGWLFGWGAGLGAAACVVALAAPAARVRRGALAFQVFAEGTSILVILSHA